MGELQSNNCCDKNLWLKRDTEKSLSKMLRDCDLELSFTYHCN